MKKPKFKPKILSALLASFVGSIILASCSQVSNEVIFSLAQEKFWPLVQALTKIVDEYNTTQKNQAGFLPVKLDTTETNQSKTESTLLNRTTTSIKANDVNNTPNLILNTPYAAVPINSSNKLLDINDIFKVSDFASKLVSRYTKIAGTAPTNRLYALPFDTASTESLAFNLPVMKAIFEAMKTSGATISQGTEANSITKKIMAAHVTDLPNSSPWKTIEGQANKLKDYTVNDQTFQTYDKLTEFAQKAKQGIFLKSGESGNPDSPVHILSIDYADNMFYRSLWADTNYAQNSYIYQYNQKNNGVDYKVLTDTNLQTKFKTAWGKFIKHTDPGLTKPQANPDQKLYLNGVYYTTNDNDWASWDLRTFKTGIAIAPTVGIPQSVQSPISKQFFASKGDAAKQKATFDSFAKYGTQVVWLNQVMKMDASSQDVYVAGGSSIVPITTTSQRDRATKNFLTWLYSANSLKEIEAGSGYFVPKADEVGDSNQIDAKIKAFKVLQETQGVKDTNSYYYYASVIASLEDLKTFYTAQNNDSNKAKDLLFNAAGDLNTVTLNAELNSITKNMTQPNGQVTTADQVLTKLKAIPLN